MTDEQLKQIIEAVQTEAWIRWNWNMVWPFLLGSIITAVTLVIKGYLPEKGKNRATKEDIQGITQLIESVKETFTLNLEKVRSELGTRSHFSKIRYERELDIFQTTWAALREVQRAMSLLVFDPEPPREERRKENIDRVEKRLTEFRNAFDNAKPFYPAPIWDDLDRMKQVFYNESYDLIHGPQLVNPYPKLVEKLQHQADSICNIIRERLKSFDV